MSAPDVVRDRGARVLTAVALSAFFLSGASSLVFQTLWSRLLSHVFGSSSVAVSSVVSVFMAGLGLGAYVFGKRADRVRDPLRLYALAETAVGCAALLVPELLRSDGWLSRVNAALRLQLGASSFGFLVARFGCIVPILIVPTTLMGATLPLLARYFVAQRSDPHHASRAVGQLYAVNTFGAVIGVFTSSFVLLPRFGVHVANSVAACTNFLLAGVIFALRAAVLRRGAQPAPAGRAPTEPGSQGGGLVLSRRLRLAAALAFAGSGLSSLLYEVVWSRALVNTIGGSLYSFSLILTTFLVGIAGGSALLASLSERRVRPLSTAAFGALAISALCFAPMGVHAGALAGVGLWLVCAGVLAAGLRMGRAQLARARLLALEAEAVPVSERRPALYLLLVPVSAALIALAHTPDRLSAITASVVVAGASFLALLIWLCDRPYLLLIGLQLFIAMATLASAASADELSLTFASMVAPLYRSLPDHIGTVQACMFATAALCVLPAALGMGAVFPAALRVWTLGGGRIGEDVGRVYAGNTLGSIFGAWLPGFVLMPTLGMQSTLYLGVAWNLITALGLAMVAALAPGTARPLRARATATAAAIPWAIAFVAFAALRPEHLLGWNISKMTLGAFRISLARDVLDEETWGAPDLVYYHDGLSTTVTVERWGRHYSLKNNGKVDASNGDDMPTQIMVAALPIMMHDAAPQKLDAAIVGFGSGVTVGAALRFPIHSLDVVELERSTVEASRFFADVNHLHYVLPDFPYVKEPRLTVIADDGRNYLAATPKRYDVVISEPSNPWLTGVSDLFTRDHFRIAKRRLKPHGIYCQWAQLYELSPQNVKILYRTFAENFRYVVVFSAEDLSSDTVLLGSDSPLPLDLGRVARAFALPGVAKELERAYVHAPEDVLARVLLSSRAEVMRFTHAAPINTDDNARIELAAPRDLIGFERYKGYLETMYAPSWPYGRVRNRLEGFGGGAAAVDHYARLVLALLAHGRAAELDALLQRAHAQGDSPLLEVADQVYGYLSGRLTLPPFRLPRDPTPNRGDPRARALLSETYARIQSDLAASHPALALARLSALPHRLRREAGGQWALLEGYLRYVTGDADGAIDVLETTLRDFEGFALEHPELHYYLARAHNALQHFDKAVRNMRVYIAMRAYPLARTAADDPPEPDQGAAPTTDAPGITDSVLRAGAVATSTTGDQAQ